MTPAAPRAVPNTAARGATRRADIPPAVRAALDAGTRETATLVEGLAVDFAALMAAAVPGAGPDAAARLADLAGAGVTQRMAAAGALVAERLGEAGARRLAAHPSDTVRGWAAYALVALPDVPFARQLGSLRPLADDPHFGVREWAWLALRPHLASALDRSDGAAEEVVALLVPWTADPSERVRRFAVEATRPRGVWSAHLRPLVRAPERGLPLLEPLRADSARYVQDSVANWLNDAAKSRPDWVRGVCARWRTESPGAATARICLRAERSLGEPA